MKDYYFYIKLNAFKNVMVRLGDGLRMAILAFDKFNKEDDLNISENTLYEMLVDLNTFSNKKSLDHFYTYISEYLLNNGEKDLIFEDYFQYSSKLYYYTTPDEENFEDLMISSSLFNYFYNTLWDKIVKIAIFDYIHLGNVYTPRNLFISFDEYKKFYPTNSIKDDDICVKFLDDLDSLLRYNHIIQMKEFNLGNNGLDLYIPIQFKFTYLN